MPDTVLLVHGWSVDSTETYGGLHEALAANGYALQEIHLGRYVSLDDRVRIEDLGKAMQTAIVDQLGSSFTGRFHVITHSTGGLVAREWFRRQWSTQRMPGRLGNFVFLAAPHFGSRLAHQGRGMLANIVKLGETGDRILEQLELGSAYQWELAEDLFTGFWAKATTRPLAFSIIGGFFPDRGIFARKILPAAMEPGSDGTVRVAAGNLNVNRYRFGVNANGSVSFRATGSFKESGFLVIDDLWHTGRRGIMESISADATPAEHEGLAAILECLGARTRADYRRIAAAHAERTRAEFTEQRGSRGKGNRVLSQLVLHMVDDVGEPVEDYRFELVYQPGPDEEPSDVVTHLHKNKIDPSFLTVFLNRHRLADSESYAFRVLASTGTNIVDYRTVEVTAKGARLRGLLQPNRTTLVEVVIPRRPAKGVFRFHVGDDPQLPVRWNRDGELQG